MICFNQLFKQIILFNILEDIFIPPPPPLLSSLTAPQIEPKNDKPVEPVSDTRSALLDAIRSGKTLKVCILILKDL